MTTLLSCNCVRTNPALQDKSVQYDNTLYNFHPEFPVISVNINTFLLGLRPKTVYCKDELPLTGRPFEMLSGFKIQSLNR